MHHQRHFTACDSRAFRHAEEILETRCHPGRLAAFVVHLCVAAGSETKTHRGNLFEQVRIEFAFERGQQAVRGALHVGETAETVAEGFERVGNIAGFQRLQGRMFRCEFHARKEGFHIGCGEEAFQSGLGHA